MGFSDASIRTKVGLVLSGVGLLFDLIGFPTPYWSTYSSPAIDTNQGLFRLCSAGVCAAYAVTVDWLAAAQALNVIGFLLGLTCVVITVVFIFFKSDMQILKKVGFGTAFAAAGFIMVGAIIYGAKINEGGGLFTLNWSFALTIISGLVYIATGIVMVIPENFKISN